MKYHLLSIANDLWHFYFRKPAGFFFYLIAITCKWIKAYKLSLKFCLRACRYFSSSNSNRLLEQLLNNISIPQSWISSGVDLEHAAQRSIVIRWPTFDNDKCTSKGVIVITFTKTFSFYAREINLEKLHRYFYLVLEPSWSGYADPDILSLFNNTDRIIVESSEIEDRILLNHFPNQCIACTFGASDWVDTGLFKPNFSQKIYDAIYIANTNPIKRIRRYMKAVQNIVLNLDKNYQACLVCASWGGAEELILGFVKQFKLEDNLTLKFSLSGSEVINVLNQSKVNVLLSLKEGSNRSLFESMFCGTPVILSSENIGVNKSYINENTGLLLDDTALENGLFWMKNNYHRYNPRQWALQNISPEITTQKLINLFKDQFNEQLSDFLIKTNNPEVSYLDYPNIDHYHFMRMALSPLLKTTNYSNSEIASQLTTASDLFQQAKSKR